MSNNPATIQKEKKKMDKVIPDHPSDSDDPTGDIECSICGIHFSDASAYESHMQGKKHQKKVAEAKLRAKNTADGQKSDEEEDDEDDDETDDMYCEVCDKHFSGYMSYVAHVKGRVHAKKVKQEKLKGKLGNNPEVLKKDGKDDDSDDDGIFPKPYARCDTCQKEFSGPEPYNMHLKGVAHKKKVKQTKAVQALKSEYGDESKNSDDEEFFSKCDVCQKSFNSVVSFKVHMQSAVHKKSLEKKKVAEEMKEFYVDDESAYVCKECKKSFPDPVGFKCHLENNNHERQKAKNALKEFLTAHPEIVFVYPLQDDGSENQSGDDGDAESDFYLICKLCHVSLSGPESAQDHVKSKKHLSAKKAKKMMKLVAKEQQKKTSSVKSDDSKSRNGNEDKPTVTKPVTTVNGKQKVPENSPVHSSEHDFELI